MQKLIPEDFEIQHACPFCGDRVTRLYHSVENENHMCQVFCFVCGASGPDSIGNSFLDAAGKAVAAWNNRI